MFKLWFNVLDPPVFSGEGREKSECLCLAPAEIAFWCTAGTPVGERLRGAMTTCYDAAWKCQEGQKCKGKEAGKWKGFFAAGQKCPSVDEVEAWFKDDYQGKTL